MSYSSTARTGSMTSARIAALVVGAVFLLVGVLGFVPGVTTHVGDLRFAGHHSHSQLLGIFQVSILHNVVHLLFGVAGLAAGRSSASASLGYLIGGGVIYLVLWVYGLTIDHGSRANVVPFNAADNWLHLALGAAMIGLGFLLSGPRATA